MQTITTEAGLPIAVYGEHDANTLEQMRMVASDPQVRGAALLADGHLGYSMPIGGVLAYDDAVSPSGVGYDIACGVIGARLGLRVEDLGDGTALAADLAQQISFGVGRQNAERVDHPLFDSPAWATLPEIRDLKAMAQQQLGTVGSGNHYVNVMADPQGQVWVTAHFGSRGLGHKIASGFLNLAAGRAWGAKAPGEHMISPATVIDLASDLGQAYWAAMELAGLYAYAGREWVAHKVAEILGARVEEVVHNHHNYAWLEQGLVVVRKGATPAAPGQRGVVGGSMGEATVILEGTDQNTPTLHSTVHGAGRVMSRSMALGKTDRKTGEVKREGLVSKAMQQQWLREAGVVLHGGGVDESPHVYRRLPEVLGHLGDTVRVVETLRPLVVVMAGPDTFDPYKD